MNEALLEQLRSVGADPSWIRWFDKPSPDVIDYLDLVEPVQDSLSLRPTCVVEHEAQPLLYVVDAGTLAVPADQHHSRALSLLKTLALRGEAGFLALSRPGQLTVYPLLLGNTMPLALTADISAGRHASLLPDLASGALPGPLGTLSAEQRKGRALGVATHQLLFRLLTEVARELKACPSLSNSQDEILALVGRALFARFLIDRRILMAGAIPELSGAPEDCFSTVKNAVFTFSWMDVRFNGDLLPLNLGDYRGFFDRLGRDSSSVCHSLSKIMYRAPGGQTDFELYWNDINFAHVPIGLLSEVYESFAHTIDARLASSESIHYTPRRIAQLLVEEAVGGVTTCRPHEAHCLDPAAGGGVFLVLLLRRLVAERWRVAGRRPSREEIDAILYRQIRGFDINISALKMAALSLYLTAIELSPEPFDAESRPFDPLVGAIAQGRVLTHVRRKGESHPNPFVIGSLGEDGLEAHEGKYDVVVGNPPWTAPEIDKRAPIAQRNAERTRLKALQQSYTDVVRRAATARSSEQLVTTALSYENPDGVPDLPFVWRAMEWCKPRGVIAYALHARLLFKRTPAGRAAQEAIFTALRVTSVVNGAALRQTDVWPNVDAPWCLLFAVNDVPEDSNVFYFLSPTLETSLNRQSRLRLDHATAEPIEFGVLRREPTLFKVLFRGTALDVDVMRRLATLQTTSLQEYWGKHNLVSGDGYQVGAGKDASLLHGKPDLRRDSEVRFFVDVDTLPRFNLRTLRRIKKAGFFTPPFVLFPESLGDRNSGGVLLALGELVFSESYYGYSTAPNVLNRAKSKLSSQHSEDLAHYLYVLGYSSLFQYVVLMTSSKFGVERDAMLKEDVDDFPLLPLEGLTADNLTSVRALSREIAAGRKPWEKVDAFVATIYGLSSSDIQVITDTLNVSLPFTSSKRRAEAVPDDATMEAFRARLTDDLSAFLSVVHSDIEVTLLQAESAAWRFLRIDRVHRRPGRDTESSLFGRWVSYLADHEGASQVILKLESGALLLGLLAQGRFWTQSRARLCASSIVSEFGDLLMLKAVSDA